MSGVRVLVGTRKGAFILSADAKRKDWKVEGPHFAGWETLSREGIARRSGHHLCIAIERLVWAGDAALKRRRKNLGS